MIWWQDMQIDVFDWMVVYSKYYMSRRNENEERKQKKRRLELEEEVWQE